MRCKNVAIPLLLAVGVALTTASSSHADTFVTGRVDFDGGGLSANDARRANFQSGGISYTNAFSNPGPGPSVGNTVNAVGFVTITSAQVGAVTVPGAVNQLIAVYAIQGNISATVPNAMASFDTGVVQVYDRGSGPVPVLSQTDPTTWIPGTATLIGTYNLGAVPTAVVQGAPFGNTTENLVVLNPALINTASSDLTGAVLGATSDFIFDAVSGSFTTDFQTVPPAGMVQTSPDQLFVRLNQTLTPTGLAPDDLAGGESASLNSIFTSFLGGGVGDFSDNSVTGGSYTPNNLASGDTVHQNDAGFAVPGAQFAPEVDVPEVPEPASLLLWGAATALGAGLYRRRRAQKA